MPSVLSKNSIRRNHRHCNVWTFCNLDSEKYLKITFWFGCLDGSKVYYGKMGRRKDLIEIIRTMSLEGGVML